MKDKSIHAYIRLWTISSVIAACTLILTYLVFNAFCRQTKNNGDPKIKGHRLY